METEIERRRQDPRLEAISVEAQAALDAAVLEGRENERSRLAAELHDGPAQALANVLFQTEILGNAMGRDPQAAEKELSSLRASLQRELDRLRAYISQLRPQLLEPQGLEDGLRESASELSNRIGIPVDVQLDAAGSTLAEDERAVALRVAQEALRNVGKHASATHAWIATRQETGPELDGDRWVLEVRDDGRGFNPDDAAAHEKRRHFGLRFMRERAELVGAELSIDTNPSSGTVVRLSIRKRGERS